MKEGVEVIATDEFCDWYNSLDKVDTDEVYRVVSLLEEEGVNLGYPYSSAIKDARYSFRELRIQSKGRPVRILYAFDPKRNAVLLVGGEKGGDDRWYKIHIPVAEKLWEEYLAQI